MKNIRSIRLVYLIIGLFVYLIIPLQRVAATGEFTANYDVSYAIAPTGVTIVTQTVSLVNRQTNFYPKQYTILLDTVNLRNIIARDEGGTITPKISQNDGKTEILLTFNQQIVGLGKETQFTLRYENLEIAQKNGSIWEVNIPGIAPDPDVGDYRVSIQTPPTFGPMKYLKPPPQDGKQWNRQQMVSGGISAAYGSTQNAKLTLRYYLENPGVTTATSDIALPPDSAYQQITIDSLSPKPTQIIKDADQNWMARYTLNPGQKLSIEARVSVRMSLTPEFTPDEVPTQAYLAQYTKALPFWEAEDPAIKALAQTYTTPKAIYEYVVSTLTYDYERVKTIPKRKGALSALKTPKESICMEFTDLFIAIARAAGIPAREVVGYAHTTNAKLRPLSLVSDVLHAWPEYYDRDKQVWIQVDPTWGNTTGGVDYFETLDFNHIAFAIHGISSSLPLPAGFYREGGKEGRDVTVEFLESDIPISTATLLPRIDFPATVTSGFVGRGNVTIENTSGVEAKDISVKIETTTVSFVLEKEHLSIPAFTTLAIPLNISIPSSLPKGTGTVLVLVSGKTVERSFAIQPISWLYLSVSGMIGSLGVLVWMLLAKPFSKKPKRA
ncbi:transglutaminase domain-containing protein [Candidatus Gottesmanbacteria bacterium]|nr:transglutaminase domain-containing protein [Candidatus Gottesmanbacteria bacterium]